MEIKRKRGDTYADELTLTDKLTGDAVNLVGCSLTMTLASVKDPIDIATKLYSMTGVIPLPATGVVLFSPSALQADRVGVFYFDVELIDGTGSKRTIASGVYQYLQDITK